MNCSLNKTDLEAIEKNLPGYVCDKYLGSGTFGKTYRLRKGSDKLALKIMKRKIGLDDSEILILRELKSECSKKRVLCYHKSFKEEKTGTYIVTEYINGKDLSKPIKKKHIYKFIAQLIDSVEYIHSKNIFHFDIKPENIMISKDDNLKLIDFGAASIIDDDSLLEFNTFTPKYSPKDSVFLDSKISIKDATRFDWYTVIKTLVEVIEKNNINEKDLLEFCKKNKKNNDINVTESIDSLKRIVLENNERYKKIDYKDVLKKIFGNKKKSSQIVSPRQTRSRKNTADTDKSKTKDTVRIQRNV